jgi:GNAT superfamily N-acetyltransferase
MILGPAVDWPPMKLEVHPLTPDRWPDLVDLFSRRGASIPRNCWCMYYRKSGTDASRARAVANRRRMKTLVDRGLMPGLIGYEDGRPVGWISLGPREDYERLARSRVMKPVDDRPVWSIVCFFVDSKARGCGVTGAMLRAAVDHARSRGATLLEAYPVDKPDRSQSDFLWFGAKSIFDRAGFREVARRSPTRPVVRKRLRPAARS